LLRTIQSLEAMAAGRPNLPLNGWIGSPYDLGSTWGLTQNYLMVRFFGDGGKALPDRQLEAGLAGVFASEHGKFAVHRTAKTISSFSWRSTGQQPAVMGLTLPLDQDVLCYPMPWSCVGQVREWGEATKLEVRSHRLAAHEDGFAVTVELGWCSNKVRQDCAFVSLPDGRSVYFEERRAEANVAIEAACSGSLTFFDDTRWVYQPHPRVFFGEQGRSEPHPSRRHGGNWINVDNRLGCAVLGADRFRLFAAAGRPNIWRGSGTMYDTCGLEFVCVGEAVGNRAPVAFKAGQLINRFGMVSCPGQKKEATAALARRIVAEGWRAAAEGVLALDLDRYFVYANFSSEPRSLNDGRRKRQLAPGASGWSTRR
jgi:hypothetical protein